MTPTTRVGQNLWRGVAIACVLGLVVAFGLWWALKDAGTKTVTAYFPTAIGLYEDNSVRIRGVEMGSVAAVEPEGHRVKITLQFDRTVPIPADAHAVLVAPSLVSDRYIQFTPAYSGGPVLEDGAIIDQDRTAVPLEVDDLYRTLIEVSDTLGPNGANKDGSLSRLLDTLAKNFKDNGKALNATITKLGKAQGTLADGKDDLFSTVTNLAKFSKTLAASDVDVAEFQQRLADVSGFLASERENLSKTVEVLGSTLGKVRAFIDDNKGRLRSNVDKLASVTKVLVDQRAAIAEIFDVGPVALGNVINSYNGATGAIDARPVINEFSPPPIMMVCEFMKQAPDQLDGLGEICSEVAPLGDELPSAGQVINKLQKGEIPLPIAELMQLQGGDE
ncbi:MAG: MCE family protein [Actinophytocola sp.]|nr:MCE family protein [Actinophytocola sp.]